MNRRCRVRDWCNDYDPCQAHWRCVRAEHDTGMHLLVFEGWPLRLSSKDAGTLDQMEFWEEEHWVDPGELKIDTQEDIKALELRMGRHIRGSGTARSGNALPPAKSFVHKAMFCAGDDGQPILKDWMDKAVFTTRKYYELYEVNYK